MGKSFVLEQDYQFLNTPQRCVTLNCVQRDRLLHSSNNRGKQSEMGLKAGTITWEIARNKAPNHPRIPRQKSIYHAPEYSIADPEIRNELAVQSGNLSGSSIAVTALRATGWAPGLIFEADPYPHMTEPISWTKIRWVKSNQEGEVESCVPEEQIWALTTRPLMGGDLAICAIEIKNEGGYAKKWHQVYGRKYTDSQSCLKEINLISALMKLTGLASDLPGRIDGAAPRALMLDVQTHYVHSIGAGSISLARKLGAILARSNGYLPSRGQCHLAIFAILAILRENSDLMRKICPILARSIPRENSGP